MAPEMVHSSQGWEDSRFNTVGPDTEKEQRQTFLEDRRTCGRFL